MTTTFVENSIYHIYNRVNGNENLFREHKNHVFFLNKFSLYLNPVVETYAFCLLPNHFHAMVRVRSKDEILSNLGDGAFQRFTKRVQK
ncbi:MAG: hypothetical protein WD038_03570 [Balneolales bacterium]